jgi:hypothetical protein
MDKKARIGTISTSWPLARAVRYDRMAGCFRPGAIARVQGLGY